MTNLPPFFQPTKEQYEFYTTLVRPSVLGFHCDKSLGLHLRRVVVVVGVASDCAVARVFGAEAAPVKPFFVKLGQHFIYYPCPIRVYADGDALVICFKYYEEETTEHVMLYWFPVELVDAWYYHDTMGLF